MGNTSPESLLVDPYFLQPPTLGETELVRYITGWEIQFSPRFIAEIGRCIIRFNLDPNL